MDFFAQAITQIKKMASMSPIFNCGQLIRAFPLPYFNQPLKTRSLFSLI